mmetsp:Transcript_30475/g.70270  ORF Transcript_30475/g.70270 Transcript_30475/m.70270 type:complete len:215 (+) Transcript_30475:1865-2509(+)
MPDPHELQGCPPAGSGWQSPRHTVDCTLTNLPSPRSCSLAGRAPRYMLGHLVWSPCNLVLHEQQASLCCEVARWCHHRTIWCKPPTQSSRTKCSQWGKVSGHTTSAACPRRHMVFLPHFPPPISCECWWSTAKHCCRMSGCNATSGSNLPIHSQQDKPVRNMAFPPSEARHSRVHLLPASRGPCALGRSCHFRMSRSTLAKRSNRQRRNPQGRP